MYFLENKSVTFALLRALAWAEASPRLLAVGARANLIGLIATALQLVGEGLYSYFNIDDLQKWMENIVWGNKSKHRNVQDEWNELAKVVQQPTCELIRDDKHTYVKVIMPGVKTLEMDSRKLQLQAYQQYRDTPEYKGDYSPGPFPLRWKECTATWATRFIVASAHKEALTLHLPISDSLQTTDFAFALNIAYQLEPERDVLHQTCFVLRNLHIINTHGVRVMTKGAYKVDSVETLPVGTGKAQFKLFKQEDLATVNA